MLFICLSSPPSPRASPTCCSQLASRSLPSCLRCCAGWQQGVSPFLLLRVTLTSSAWPGSRLLQTEGGEAR